MDTGITTQINTDPEADGSFTATMWNNGIMTKIPTSASYSHIKRLQEIREGNGLQFIYRPESFNEDRMKTGIVQKNGQSEFAY